MKKEIIAAGGLVINDNDELLLIYRRNKWDLPKGKLDDGESIETCAVREVQEETGVHELTLGALIGTTEHNYMENHEHLIKKTYWYKMKAKGVPQLHPQREEQITGAQWVSEKDIKNYLENTYQNIIDIIHRSGFIQNK